MENIICKVGVVVCVCTTNVVAFIASLFYKVLKFGNNYVVASFTIDGFTKIIVNLFSAVKA